MRPPRDRHRRPAAEPARPVAREDAGAAESSPLAGMLQRLDRQEFGRYRQIVGSHAVGEFELRVDRVPPDPFAGGARVRIVADRETSRIPAGLSANPMRCLAAEDYVARRASEALAKLFGTARRTAPGHGRAWIEPVGPAVIERSACRVSQDKVELRLLVDLPAYRRRIQGRQAEELLCSTIPRLATMVLVFSARKAAQVVAAADQAEDHGHLQAELSRRGLVAFVADGSQLARAAGDDPAPRRDGREVAFEAPESMRVQVELPHRGKLHGMGIPGGVTLIVGGAFHGKSTLLDGIATGVHPHPPGDGREWVATRPDAVSIRAEDGRSVRRADISGFLGELPSGVLASEFSTDKASGATSQVASIVEAWEAGAGVLLIDEDRAATNFMIRDGRMQRLVPREAEPLVPFVDRVRELYDTHGISTILVTGGSGDYLGVADRVIRMDAYRPIDVTEKAREIAGATRSMRLAEPVAPLAAPPRRVPSVADGTVELRTAARGPHAVRVGDRTIDLQSLDQLVEPAQTRALGRLVAQLARRFDGEKTLVALLDEVGAWLDAHGLDALDRPASYDLARPRRYELAAAVNRWRALRVERALERE